MFYNTKTLTSMWEHSYLTGARSFRELLGFFFLQHALLLYFILIATLWGFIGLTVKDGHEPGKCGSVCGRTTNFTESGDLFVNRTGLWFIAPETPLKGSVVPLNGVDRKPEKQLCDREQLALCCSAVLGCLGQSL